MNRREFGVRISQLFLEMAKDARDGLQPIYDWMLRSPEAQFALYKVGRVLRDAWNYEGKTDEFKARNGIWDTCGKTITKCDGYVNRSNHQGGLAADIYLVQSTPVERGGEIVKTLYDWPPDEAERWHKRWEEMGGKPALRGPDGKMWDAPHFEG